MTALLLQLLTPLLSLGVTWVVKMVIPKIPGFLTPVVASAIGAGATVAAAAATGTALNPLVGAALGLAATGLHQIGSQLSTPSS